ncbi:MAG: M2 family metallopeptidase [Candidatus Eisenbacteria bacterium]
MNRRMLLTLGASLVIALQPMALSAPGRADSPGAAATSSLSLQERADRFLALVNACYRDLYTLAERAEWNAVTDVRPEHDAAAAAAGKALAAFSGNPALITESRALLERAAELDPLTVLQLRQVLLNAAEGPMTNPELVAARVDAETAQSAALNSFLFTLDEQPITPNEIDERLLTLEDLDQRLAVWEASKQSGPALKPGLIQLQSLRNGVARELGYPDYFALQAAGHAMTTDEMLALQDQFLEELRPLYLQIHTWAKHELARTYGRTVPERIPAHWLPNRWAQDWSALVEVPGLELAFQNHTAEWIVKTAEDFYVSIGRPPLPASFWRDSDLYPVPRQVPRLKNSHASCWHIDLDRDIRALMSVEPDEYWFGTAHHELGHGHYDLAYSRPEVPPLLRTGASSAFHEAFAGLGDFSARQLPYLESLGLLPAGQQTEVIPALLREALGAIPFMFFASGTMTHWEADFYAAALPPEQWNARWWKYVERYQGVTPPAPRGEEFCDAATKTHISDAPAYYFSYAVAAVIQHQLHDHIAREILGQDPRRCNYAGHPEVGAFFEGMQRLGATRDWREILRDATGEELSTRAMAEYYRPLMAWLEEQNRGRKIGWE